MNKALEEHTIWEHVKSLTWKDLFFLFGILAIAFGVGVFFDKQFGEMNNSAKSKIASMDVEIDRLEGNISKLSALNDTARTIGDKHKGKLDSLKIQLRNYRQCLSSLIAKSQSLIENERERLLAAAGTTDADSVRIQVIDDWKRTLKPQTDQVLATLDVSLSGEGGTCVLRISD